ATDNVQHRREKEAGQWTHFLSSIPLLIILVGASGAIFQIIAASLDSATDAYNALQELTEPKHDAGDLLSIEQRTIVERYSATYCKTQLLTLDEDERFVANQIAKHKRDRRWLHVQSSLEHFARVYATKPSQNQISQHFFALWRQLEDEVRARATEKASPTAD
ncbi:MAG: hypothetical protein JO308_08040, partial [Verrucomicrobia bacterium]|nr:hypothetical protein [Verrucomicrobiota bacterium]